MNSNRRNGKPASCEPCRKNKTKCDHTTPTCNRCHERGITDKCFYHPAPLTKRPELVRGDGQHTAQLIKARKRKRSPNNRSSRIRDETIQVVPTPSSTEDNQDTDAVSAETFRTGYLGPTSYALILPQGHKSSTQQDRQASVSSEHSELELPHQHPLTKSIRTQMATDVIKTLRHFTLIREVVLEFCEICQVGTVPMPMEVDAVNALGSTVDRYDLVNTLPDPQLVATVLENTSRPLVLSVSLTAREFYKMYTGDNLRFETIGWLLATAGRSFLWTVGSCRQDDNSLLMTRLAEEMLRASTTCLIICSLVSPVSDLMIWLFHENLLFTMMMCGYSGPPTWRRLGELTTQMYALGIHKETSNSNLPLFILETRRRLFCSAYNVDKIISTFLGRPVRLSKKHTDIKLPLDISDDDLTRDEATLRIACQRLDDHGWNSHEDFYEGHRRASWLRVRYISMQFREDILDFALAKLNPSVELQLLDISRRIRETWDSLPAHLQSTPVCWSAEIPPGICLGLLVIYLMHFYNEFMIQKLLADSQPTTQNFPLLRVSMDLLSTTMSISAIRDRSYDISRDFFHCVLLFGVPSGSVLATALQEQHHTGQPFPASISRSEIIRTLSVLISHLNTASHLYSRGRFGDANYDLCRKAAKTFTKLIDAVLDAKSDETPSMPAFNLDLDLDLFTAPGLDGFEGVDLSGGLADGFDWGAIGQWTL